MNQIEIRINGRSVTAAKGDTVMQAADRAGIVIPRLCFHPAVRSSGACRLCAVEIDGYRGLPAACSTETAEGMRVSTDSPRVLEFRREMLLLILKEHPRECLSCPRNGTCELQQLVKAVGIDFPYEPPVRSAAGAGGSGPYFERDYRLCVRCGRCVRVCHEVRGNRAIVFKEAAGRQEVATRLGGSLAEAGCQFCGACVDVCPVGALREAAGAQEHEMRAATSSLCGALTDIVLTLYRRQLVRELKSSRCTLCSAACPMVFDIAGGRVLAARPDPNRGVVNGQACVQGRFLLKGYIHKEDRLRSPAVLKDGGMTAASWDDALSAAADGLGGFEKGEVIIVTDTAGSNEDLSALREVAGDIPGARIFITDDGGYLEASGILAEDLGAKAVRGAEKGLSGVNGILVLGVNLAGVNPILSVAVRQAALAGATLITANPLETSLGRIADLNIAYYPGSEDALLKGLLRLLLNKADAVGSRCRLSSGELEALRERLSVYDLETVQELTGVSEERLAEASCLLARMTDTAVIFGGGFLESPSGKEALKALEALAMILNGRDRLPIIPVYGGPNVKGAFSEGLLSATKGGAGPLALNGWKGSFKCPGDVKAALVAMRNLHGRRSEVLDRFLKEVPFVVVMAERDPGLKADVILPVADILETGGTFTDFTGAARDVPAVLPKPAGAMWLGDALRALAKRISSRGAQGPVRGAGSPPPIGPRRFIWEPSDSRAKGHRDPEHNLALFSKDAFRPYFLGPLLAEEATLVFHGKGDIQMNPADAYSMELMPGDRVAVSSKGGDITGTLGLNSLLARGMAASTSDLFGKTVAGGAIFCRVSKA